jgi:hypothetical protein
VTIRCSALIASISALVGIRVLRSVTSGSFDGGKSEAISAHDAVRPALHEVTFHCA